MYSKNLLTAFVFCLFMISSCKKDSTANAYPISGLWEGTYTCCSQPALYFSFPIYPDGSLSYKSKGINNYTFYAVGTWTLNGSTFNFDVTTTNTPGTQSHQVGSATYSNTGTLTNGVNTDVDANISGAFSMNRVN